MQRSKRWSITLNNWTHLEWTNLFTLPDSEIKFLIVGKEVGEEGTPHLQGYVEFCSRKTLNSAKLLLGTRWHLEVSRGTAAENIAYCQKDGSWCTRGEPMQQGRRNDLDQIITNIRDGSSFPDLWNEFPAQMIRYERGIRSAYQNLSPHMRMDSPSYQISQFRWGPILDYERSVILWGNAGIGKSEYARALMPTALFVSHIDDLTRFDSSIHEGIIFDDMDFKHFPRTAQIHIVDQTQPRSIHCRYTTAHIPPFTNKIFLTNESMGNIFDLTDGAIRRRCNVRELLLEDR